MAHEFSQDFSSFPVSDSGEKSCDLSDNEIRLRHFADASLALLLTLNDRYEITYCNSRAAELFGYEPTEMIGLNLFDSIVNFEGTEFDELHNPIRDVFEDPKILRNQSINQGRRKNGTAIWISWSFLENRDEQETLLEIYCVGNDLTMQRESLTQFQLTVQGIGFGHWNLNLITGEGTASSAWFAIRGLDPYSSAPLRTLWFEAIHANDYPNVRNLLQEHFRNESPVFHGQFRVLNPEKGWIWIRSVGHVSGWDASGNPEWISGFDQDITREVNDAEELKKHQNLLQEVIRIGRMGYWVYDYTVNGISAISDTMYDILEIDRTACAASLFFDRFESSIHPEDRTRMIDALFSPIDAERKTECRITTASGKELDLLIYSHSIVDDSGRVVAQVAIFQDTTEQKRVEYTLREQQLSLFHALRVCQAGFWQYDLEAGQMEIINDAYDLFRDFQPPDSGKTSEADHLHNLPLFQGQDDFLEMVRQWIHPSDLPRVWETLVQAITVGGTFEFECRILNRQNTVRYVRQSGIITRNLDRKTTKILGVVLDISEIMRREKEIHESEARYRILFDHSFDAVTVFENEKIVQCNTRAVELYRADNKTRLQGLSPFSLAPDFQPDGTPSVDILTRRIRECGVGKTEPFTLFSRRLDGTEFESTISLSPVPGSGSLVYAVTRDITEQKVLQRTMEYYRAYLAILAELRDSFYSRSEREIITAFLSSVTKHFGISKTWFGISHKGAIRPVLHSGDAQGFVDYVRVETYETPQPDEFPLSQAIREKRAVHVSVVETSNDRIPWVRFMQKTRLRSLLAAPLEVNGVLEGGLVFYSFESKLFEDFVSEYLQSGIRELSRILTETRLWEHQQRDLEQAKEKAEAAAEAKTRFLANMSHEIRTPMTAILGFAEVLTDRQNSKEFLLETAQIIHNNARFLLHILNDILDFSKLEADKMSLEIQRIDLRQLIAEVHAPFSVQARQKKIFFTVRSASPFPESINSDAVRLKQILLNLVGNAVKFTKVGGVELVLSWKEQQEDNESEPSDKRQGRLHFEIVDSGIGISTSQIDAIFSPFNQGDASTTRKFGGTGLGLAISQRLIRMLGGELSVQSEPGAGSTFTVELPQKIPLSVRMIEELGSLTSCSDHPIPVESLSRPITSPAVKEGEAGPDSEISSEPKPLAGLRILLAEDGRDNQRLFSLILEKAGAQVDLADNGLLALKFVLEDELSGESFDIVLMDMQMPVMDGYTATRKIREHGCTLPIIALTAHAMQDERQKCLAAGCNDYATKPILRDALIEVVRANILR